MNSTDPAKDPWFLPDMTWEEVRSAWSIPISPSSRLGRSSNTVRTYRSAPTPSAHSISPGRQRRAPGEWSLRYCSLACRRITSASQAPFH